MENKSDRDLVKYLNEAPADVVYSLVELMDTFWQRDIRKLRKSLPDKSNIPAPSTPAREQIAGTLATMLRYFGSHGVAYAGRSIFSSEPGVSYHEILFDVLKAVHKKVKATPPLPRVASVKDYERILCEDLLRIQFQDRSESEIAEMLLESGLGKEAADVAAEQVALLAAGGTTFLLALKVLA